METEPQYNRPNYPYGVEPRYEEAIDSAERYGSIIKDLIATEVILEKYELQLRGKKKDSEGKIMDDPTAEPYIKTDRAAREYVNLLKSMVNTHNDMTYYEPDEAGDIMDGAIRLIPWWLMLQGDDIPTRYRRKIGWEGLSLINASLHKAINGRMLVFLKGSFREGTSYNMNPDKKSALDYIMPWRKKNN